MDADITADRLLNNVHSHGEGTMRAVVCRATIAEVDSLAPLFNAFREFYRKPSDWILAKRFLSERFQNDESIIFIAIGKRGSAIGFTQLFPTFSSASAARMLILNDLFVSPDARRQGVGASLLRAARDFGQKIGAVRLTL
jgi:GNAT superfamily N-acetyltransferase